MSLEREIDAMGKVEKTHCSGCGIKVKAVRVKYSQLALCPKCYYGKSSDEMGEMTANLLIEYRKKQAEKYSMKNFPVEKAVHMVGGDTEYFKKNFVSKGE